MTWVCIMYKIWTATVMHHCLVICLHIVYHHIIRRRFLFLNLTIFLTSICSTAVCHKCIACILCYWYEQQQRKLLNLNQVFSVQYWLNALTGKLYPEVDGLHHEGSPPGKFCPALPSKQTKFVCFTTVFAALNKMVLHNYIITSDIATEIMPLCSMYTFASVGLVWFC